MEIIYILTFVELVLIIVFPTIGFLGGSAFSTLGVLCLIPFAIYTDKKKEHTKEKDIRIRFIRITLIFSALQLAGAFFCAIFSTSSGSTFAAIKWTIMLPVYAYVFTALASDYNVRCWMKYAIIISGFVLGIYSIYSYITSSNIYVDYFSPFFQSQEVGDANRDYSELRGISHRVYGNVNNPVFFSGELMMLLAFCCYTYTRIKVKNNKKNAILVIMLTIFIGCVFTGSKSGLIPSLLFLLYVLLNDQSNKRNKVKAIIMIAIIALLLVPILSNLFGVDINRFGESMNPFESEVGGSNFNSRMEEYSYLGTFVGGNFLFGNGLGWCYEYYLTHGPHPILHTFESLIMSSYVDMGLWGLFVVYPYFMISNYKIGLIRKNTPFYRVYLLGFFFFAIATGLGMIKFFYVWGGVMLCDYYDEVGKQELRHKLEKNQ